MRLLSRRRDLPDDRDDDVRHDDVRDDDVRHDDDRDDDVRHDDVRDDDVRHDDVRDDDVRDDDVRGNHIRDDDVRDDAVDERHEYAHREVVQYNWSPANVLVVLAGAALAALGIVALIRTQINDTWYTPVETVARINHTPLLGALEVGVGALLVILGLLGIRTLTAFMCVAGAVAAAVAAIDPSRFETELAIERWWAIALAFGGAAADEDNRRPHPQRAASSGLRPPRGPAAVVPASPPLAPGRPGSDHNDRSAPGVRRVWGGRPTNSGARRRRPACWCPPLGRAGCGVARRAHMRGQEVLPGPAAHSPVRGQVRAVPDGARGHAWDP
jgi:hypothetical protein